MANRQARREQRRATRRDSGRQSAPSGGSRRPQSTPPRKGGSGLPDWLTQPFTIGIIVLVLVLGAAVVAFSVMGGGDGDDELVEALEAVSLPTEMANGTVMGSDDAPLRITAFEDYQCPFCLRSTALSEPGIYDYIRSGDVQFEFSPFPILGDESSQAALAAACAADQNLFWQYSHELYLTQAEAGQVSNERLNVGRFDNDNLKEIATTVGLDRSIFDTCLESFQHQSTIDEAVATARNLGVTSTPSFAVNGQLIPAQSTPSNAEQWGVFIDSLLEQQAGGEATGTPADGETPADNGTATAEEGDSESPTAEASDTPSGN